MSEEIEELAFVKHKDEESSRFSGADWFETAKMMNIYIVGCGGVGSWAAINLARFFPASITLYDDDLVETGNMSGQFYEDVEGYKVAELSRNISRFTNYITPINTYEGKFTQENIKSIQPNSVIVIGIDNQKEKKNIMNAIHILSRRNVWVIDARLSMDTFQIITMNDKIYFDYTKFKKYSDKFLFDDADADRTICSLKQTSFMANMIGGMIGNVYMTICKCISSDFPVYVPYFIEYSDNYSLKIKYFNDEM